MNAKPLAALTSSLLARKGQAKPAMRPQGFNAFGHRQEDLGWNDMGADVPAVAPEPTPPPPVVIQQQQLSERLAPPPRAPRIAVRTGGAKAAFTLRLDAERHLRLRLASAVRHRSSQQLVTDALDALLAGMPELEPLVIEAKSQQDGKK